MTLEQKHRDALILYIVLGIVAVVGITAYVYMELAAMSAQQAAAVPSTAPTQAQIRQNVVMAMQASPSKPAPPEVHAVLTAMFAKHK